MYIPIERIIVNQQFASAEIALQEIGAYLVQQGIVAEPYVDSLLRRQQQYGVYIGNFVALPHAEEQAHQWIMEEGSFYSKYLMVLISVLKQKPRSPRFCSWSF